MAENKPIAKEFKYTAQLGTMNERVGGLGQEIGFRLGTVQAELNAVYGRLVNRAVNFQAIFEKDLLDLFVAIKLKTPVDTGRAKSGWRIAVLNQQKFLVQWRITNFSEYIVFLEFGHSMQAPKGMVRISLDKFSKTLKARLKRLSKDTKGKGLSK